MEVTPPVVSILVVRRFLLITLVVIAHTSMMMVWRSVVLTNVLVSMRLVMMVLALLVRNSLSKDGMLFLIIANNSSCFKLELNGGGRKGRKQLISFMWMTNSFTFLWRGFEYSVTSWWYLFPHLYDTYLSWNPAWCCWKFYSDVVFSDLSFKCCFEHI